MGLEQSKQKGPVEPQKTIKEQVKQYTKQINKMRRQYGRQKYKLEYEGKTLNRGLKRKIAKKYSKQAQKMIAHQIIKNNQMIAKYNKLDNQLQNLNFQLQQMAVNQSMQNVMHGMAKIMSGPNNKMKEKGYQETIKKFMTEKERMNVLNEYVQDVMNADDGQIEDQDVDKLIYDMKNEAVAKEQQKIEEDINLDDYQNDLNDI